MPHELGLSPVAYFVNLHQQIGAAVHPYVKHDI